MAPLLSGTTIAALASPPGPALRGVLRISGDDAFTIAQRVIDAPLPTKRGSLHARLDDGVGKLPVLVLAMPGPASYTREDVIELHLPGSPFLLERALGAVLDAGALLAQPGEFTRRAFLSGRIDLARAEGVLALVNARSQSERKAATALLFGGLSERTEIARSTLEALRAVTEASLDFDESDTGHIPARELAEQAGTCLALLDEATRFEEERVRETGEPRVVLAGLPNAGKSALFNRLTGQEQLQDAALVSSVAGTTRDTLVGRWRVDQMDVRLIDTAGVEAVAGEVEQAAQARTEHARDAADLVLWVVDGSVAGDGTEAPPEALVVLSKADLSAAQTGSAGLRVSAHTGAGLDALEAEVAQRLMQSTGVGRSIAVRHRRALSAARELVEHALRELEAGLPLDVFAETLRRATDELDDIQGRTTPEDLLDRIFAQFCLGK